MRKMQGCVGRRSAATWWSAWAALPAWQVSCSAVFCRVLPCTMFFRVATPPTKGGDVGGVECIVTGIKKEADLLGGLFRILFL